jgi:hypothetical protein
MVELALRARSVSLDFARGLWGKERIWLVSAVILIAIFVLAPVQGVESLEFTLRNIAQTGPG